jgi:hypothetical protein
MERESTNRQQHTMMCSLIVSCEMQREYFVTAFFGGRGCGPGLGIANLFKTKVEIFFTTFSLTL